MFIDNKGRLFGKINIIDFLFILFLISLAPMLYYGYKILNQPPPPPPPPPPKPIVKYLDVPVTVFCLFKGVDKGMVDKISSGSMEKNAEGKVIAKVKEVISKSKDLIELDMGRGVKIKETLPDKYQVLVKLEILPEIKNDILYHKDIRLGLDAVINFKTDDYELRGKLSPPPPPKKKWVRITVFFDNISNDIARFVTEGDRQKDDSGSVIVELKKIIYMKGAETVRFIPNIGQYRNVPLPGRKDAKISFRVLAVHKRDVYIYKSGRVLVGTGFTFQTDSYQISGTIVDVEK